MSEIQGRGLWFNLKYTFCCELDIQIYGIVQISTSYDKLEKNRIFGILTRNGFLPCPSWDDLFRLMTNFMELFGSVARSLHIFWTHGNVFGNIVVKARLKDLPCMYILGTNRCKWNIVLYKCSLHDVKLLNET